MQQPRHPNDAVRRAAVFLDRDGTIIEDANYLSDPAGVRLLEHAVDALRRLRDAGYALVVVTNQSAVGRGWLSLDDLHAIHDELNRQLAAQELALDAIYYCPVAPTSDDPDAIDHPDRKPAPGMLFRAAADLGLDLAASWMIGDRLSDALAGLNAGCRGAILVRTGREPLDTPSADERFTVVDDLRAAANQILTSPSQD